MNPNLVEIIPKLDDTKPSLVEYGANSVETDANLANFGRIRPNMEDKFV